MALAHFQNGLLALLDVFDQLDRRRIAVLDVISDFLAGHLIAVQHLPVLRVQAQLRQIVVVQLDDIFVAFFKDVNVRLNLARARDRNSAGRDKDPDGE